MALILDTGPVLAYLDRSDRDHHACRALIAETAERRIIPSPVLVEVDYWCSERLGVGAFLALLADVVAGAFALEHPTSADLQRIHVLVDRYADNDLGYVDAAVISLAERLAEPKVATLDHRHFSVVRPAHVDALELLPG